MMDIDKHWLIRHRSAVQQYQRIGCRFRRACVLGSEIGSENKGSDQSEPLHLSEILSPGRGAPCKHLTPVNAHTAAVELRQKDFKLARYLFKVVARMGMNRPA